MTSRHVFRLLVLLGALFFALLFHRAAGAQTPEPPRVNLEAPRYDSAQNLYLLDFVYERPEKIGSLQISVVDDRGMVVARLNVRPEGRNQSVPLDARLLETDHTYRIEVIGFDKYGALIRAGQGSQLLASREFTVPGSTLGEPLFAYQYDPPTLLIRLQETSEAHMVRYSVSIVEKTTNAVVLEHQEDGRGKMIQVPLGSLPGGTYRVVVRALDEQDQELAVTSGETTYMPPPRPGVIPRLMKGMAAYPLIPLLIAAIVISVSVGLILQARMDQGPISVDPLPHTNPARPSKMPSAFQITVANSPDGRLAGKTIPVTRSPFLLGRGDADLSIDGDRYVSARHAELIFNRKEVTIRDLLTDNGTYVNGERIPAERTVRLDPTRETRLGLGLKTTLVLAPATWRFRLLPKFIHRIGL